MQLLNRAESSTSSNSSASPASGASGVTSTPASTSVSASSDSSSSSTDGAAGQTVTKFVSAPAYTATKTTAYTAHGINATIKTGTATSTYNDVTYLMTANATSPGIPKNELTACKINGTQPDNGPFCTPYHGQSVWLDYTYAITWNHDLFAIELSQDVELRFDNGSRAASVPSDNLTSFTGYMNLNFQKSIYDLGGFSSNNSSPGVNLTFWLIQPTNSTKGPTVTLTVNPATLPKVLIPKLPARYGLEIGLPIGVVAALLVILALWCGLRKHNRSWKDVKGHSKDYMARRSRRRGKFKEGGIQLDDFNEADAQAAYSDGPYTASNGNAFRDEVARQREEDDRYRSNVTSF